MRKHLLTSLCLLSLALGGCGALANMAGAARDSAALEERSEALDGRMRELEAAVKSYEELAADLGPEYVEKYDQVMSEYEKVKGYVQEGRDLLGDAKSVHDSAMEQARNPDTGEVDWAKYAMLMLAGGGGLYSERRRTRKEQGEAKDKQRKDRDRLHARMDKRKDEVGELQAELARMKQEAEMEQARRGEASA